MSKITLILVSLSACISAYGHDLKEVQSFFNGGGGPDLTLVEITTKKIGENLYVLEASGGNAGNILASVGEQGTLIIDSMYAPIIPKIRTALTSVGSKNIDFAINTHFHFDHTDGNPVLARDGTHIVAQSKARRSMVAERPIDGVRVGLSFLQEPYPKDTLPIITFDEKMQFHFNGETFDLLHFAPAHTGGDAVIYLRTSNIMHLGDVFNNDGYPFIDTSNGGSIDGMIEFCKGILAVIDRETTLLPGHGELMAYDDLVKHIAMLESVRDRILSLIDAGYSQEEVVAAKPTEQFDASYADLGFAGDPAAFVIRTYISLTE